MRKHAFALVAMGVLAATCGFAKNKAKSTLPPYVLSARTVTVLIDPDAGVSIADPQANQVAQKDVEKALLNWGRLIPMMGTTGADLIIMVRRGHGRLVDQTIHDPRQNSRPGAITPTDNGISIGAQHGTPPNTTGGVGSGSDNGPPHSQMEVGAVDDSFTVYEGGGEDPLDTVPAWRYVAKDGLRPHTVPAVEEFRKAIAEAEKAAAAKHP